MSQLIQLQGEEAASSDAFGASDHGIKLIESSIGFLCIYDTITSRMLVENEGIRLYMGRIGIPNHALPVMVCSIASSNSLPQIIQFKMDTKPRCFPFSNQVHCSICIWEQRGTATHEA